MGNARHIDEETLDRNWTELLQELRVVGTGQQILTAFLLTVPFSNRFDQLDQFQRHVYLALISTSVLALVLVMSPVAFHRVLFRRRRRYALVQMANATSRFGLAVTGLTVAGVLFLVFDFVGGRVLAVVVLAAALAVMVALWLVMPWILRGEPGPDR